VIVVGVFGGEVLLGESGFRRIVLLDYAVALFLPEISELVVVVYGLKNRCVS